MPKAKTNPPPFDRSTATSYAPISAKNNTEEKKNRSRNHSQPIRDEKEWEEARCPICMDPPHNAVLLLCSSHDKGCRPYMCDTNTHHSNCLFQFRKSVTRSPFSCPLCRGRISKWIVVEPARKVMDSIRRNCSAESCEFIGTYAELEKHAVVEHPSVLSSEADLIRHKNWTALERERELHDSMALSNDFQGVLAGNQSAAAAAAAASSAVARRYYLSPRMRVLPVPYPRLQLARRD